MDGIGKDVRFAVRTLRSSPGFATVAICSLALAIGANTAIFSFANAILLQRLPVPEPERLVTISQLYRGKLSGVVWTLRTVDELAARDPALDGVFGWFSRPVDLSQGDAAHWVHGDLVTGEYFRTLQVKPAAGRLFDDADVRDAAANPVCVLSYELWQREFAGDPGAVGKTVFLNGHPYRVLGVGARGFYGAQMQQRFDVAIPATRIGDFMPALGSESSFRGLSWLVPMARIKPDLNRTEAEQQTRLAFRDIEPGSRSELHFNDGSQGIDPMRSSFGRPVIVLMAVVGLVLIAACVNLANLLLARAQARGREFALRLALGASRARLIRQLLCESLLLAACGGSAGVVLSFWIGRTLLAFLNTGRPVAEAIHVAADARVLVFSVLLTLATAILFGLVPAWQASRPELVPALKRESGGGGPGSRILLRRALVVMQIALSLVIVFAAGLLTRTLSKLATVDLGYQPERVIALLADPSAAGYSAAESSRIFELILDRARDLPGVSAASLAVSSPGGPNAISMPVEVPGYIPRPVRGDNVVNFNFVSPRFFATLGQPLLRGRDFDDRDEANSPRVAIVNEKFARHFLNGQAPVGKKFRQGGGDIEIIGVVRDARDQGARSGPEDTVYLPEKQSQNSGLTVLARTAGEARPIVTSLAAIVRSIDPHVPVFSVHTLNVDLEAGLSSERILGYLSTLFAAMATLLAAIGLYGVLAYSVARRTPEIGIRFALGARRSDVASLFARESIVLVLGGIAVGAPAAILSARALGSVLFEVAPSDPMTQAASIVVLAVAALAATSIPLWRASRVEPMSALRHE
jgi:predicted permease